MNYNCEAMKELIKRTFKRFLRDNPSKLSSKALKRANNMQKPIVGTPHDWEDYEKYLKEFEKEHDQ